MLEHSDRKMKVFNKILKFCICLISGIFAASKLKRILEIKTEPCKMRAAP
jgi:hypothetical protein